MNRTMTKSEHARRLMARRTFVAKVRFRMRSGQVVRAQLVLTGCRTTEEAMHRAEQFAAERTDAPVLALDAHPCEAPVTIVQEWATPIGAPTWK